MKKLFGKFAALLTAVVLVVTFTTPLGWAAQGCRVSFSDPSVTVGNNVTITVNVSGSVGAATIKMNYDQRYLQFVSGNLGYGSGGGGLVTLDNENASAGNMSFSMTFKALTTGSTTVTCVGYDIVDGNGDAMAVTMGQSAVTINAAPTASSNNNLSSLSISPGTLSPAFSAGTTKYKASVSNATTSVAVSAKTEDRSAKMVYWGNSGLKVGNNTITVQVTAENGAKKYYTITVNRAGSSSGDAGGGNTQITPTPTPAPTPDNTVYATLPDGVQLPIATQLPQGAVPPQGFEQGQLDYQGQSFPCITLAQLGLSAVYLTGDEAHTPGFYFLDTQSGAARLLSVLPMGQRQLILVDLPLEQELPQGYEATEVTLGGVQHRVLAPQDVEQPNHYIVYALDQDGKLGMYLYDVEQDSYQRYQFAQLPQQEPEQEPEEEQRTGFAFMLAGRVFQTDWSDALVSKLMLVLATLGVVLLVAVIVLAVCLARSRRSLHWQRHQQEEQRQLRIVQGSGMTVDEILAEQKMDHLNRNNETDE